MVFIDPMILSIMAWSEAINEQTIWLFMPVSCELSGPAGVEGQMARQHSTYSDCTRDGQRSPVVILTSQITASQHPWYCDSLRPPYTQSMPKLASSIKINCLILTVLEARLHSSALYVDLSWQSVAEVITIRSRNSPLHFSNCPAQFSLFVT